MARWRALFVWLTVAIIRWELVGTEKVISLFLRGNEKTSDVSKILIPISNHFGVIIRSADIDEASGCDSIRREGMSMKERTSLILMSDRPAFACNKEESDGKVIFSSLTASGVKFGSIFHDAPETREGNVHDLVSYLDSITKTSAVEREVGDKYIGAKEHSIADPVAIPVPVAIVVVIVIIIMVLLMIFLCWLQLKEKKQQALKSKRESARSKSERSPTKDKSSKSKSKRDKRPKSVSEKSGKSDKSKSGKSVPSPAGQRSKTGSVERMSTFSAEKVNLKSAEKSDDKKKEGEMKQRDLAEVIKQPLTSKEFEVYLNRLAHFAIEYYDNPTIYDVTPNVSPGFLYNTMPKNCPDNPETFKEIYDDIKAKIMPGLTHWQHPNFFAYYPIGRCYPDLLADFITSALSVIGFSWDSCPALTEMENAMVNWVGRALGFPEAFLFQDSPPASQGGGTVTESGSDAILCAVLAARQWKINQIIEDEQLKGGSKFDTVHDIGKRLVVYSSKDAHSCIEKACKLAMLRCRPIQPLEENQWGITGQQIEEEIKKDLERGLIPCFINCTLGTSSTASCDKLTSISPVAKKYDTWLHVDAAYAGSTFIDTKYREVAEGIENAHTINVNLSKFLLHSATLSIIWTREQKVYKDAFSITPMYLKPSHGSSIDLRDWGLHLSRRFKALKVWFIMRMCGVEGLRRHVNKICDMASYFESLIDQHPNLQIFTPRNFGLFTFQYSEPSFTKEERNRHTLRLLCFLNDSHKIYLTPVRVADNDVIRVSLSYERTTKETIDKAFHLLKTMTEQYKQRKDDPTLVKPQSLKRLIGSAELPLVADAEIDIGPTQAARTGAAEQDSTSVTAPSTAETQSTKPQPSKSTELSVTQTQQTPKPPPSKTPPPALSSATRSGVSKQKPSQKQSKK
ncbi:hypothetical protein GCK32_007279 [Trichostrongylus colubriformis]|uniref:Uncharacterized protein n=1 Tax=Trichostrongylus colubriformis TaxID=6319 RepID=A0AAN8FH48_TRICO